MSIKIHNRTLVKAIENKKLATWPGLTEAAMQKHLLEAYPATDKDHMKHQRKGIRSTTLIPDSNSNKGKTKAALEQIEIDRDINPPQEFEKQNQNFCYNGLTNEKDGTNFVKFTRKSPIRSMYGVVAIFIFYDWTTNEILATPVNNMKEETIVDCFKQNIQYILKRGFKLVLKIINNVAS